MSVFDFKEFLIQRGWTQKNDTLFIRGFKSIKFVQNNSIMIALNNDKKVKYSHVVTCKVPVDFNQAEVLTELTYLK